MIVRGEWSGGGGGGGGGNWSQRAAFRMNGGGGRPPRAYAGSGAGYEALQPLSASRKLIQARAICTGQSP